MANLPGKYESIFIVSPAVNEEDTKAIVTRFTDLVTANATLESCDEWGKRKLAYPINDFTEGYYVLMTFTAPTDFVAELSRIYNITDGVIRSLVIRVNED
jgi:small subunit ribosomal protein S6